MFIEISPLMLGSVPVVMALVSLAKLYVDSYWAPIMALGFGILTSWGMHGHLIGGEVLMQGVLVGLSAAGVYSGGRKMLE